MATLTMEWAAGLFEGEGCISINKSKRGTPAEYWCVELQLMSTDQDVVETFHSVVGVGTLNVNWSAAQQASGRKKAWLWRALGKDAEALGWALLPYLHNRRRERFTEVLLAVRDFREQKAG